uniref:Uncharacterized protein n=1 Tax=Podoviridae sp. ct8Lf7 TaxID=2827723 RepID=A0A8S5S0J5_9CAUD|nr:MAG TPA: hypothetical protein [Podoviridae sp. ct8Lf7]
MKVILVRNITPKKYLEDINRNLIIYCMMILKNLNPTRES